VREFWTFAKRDSNHREWPSDAACSSSIGGCASGENLDEYNKTRRHSDLKNPAETCVLVEEADGRGTNVGSWQFHFRPLPLSFGDRSSTMLGIGSACVADPGFESRVR
jgi:hypothetical protein